MQVNGWNDGGGPFNTNFSVGDGHHGSFNVSTYANFGTVSANVITINTNTYSDLQFTDFTLNAGYTIRPIGSNPLIIRSQSDILINGTIDCSGGAGTDANATNTILSAGGTAHCGGGAGGNGGTAALAPTAGAAGGVGLVGAQAGPSGGANGGATGAGGEAYRQAGTPAHDGMNPNGGGVATHNLNNPDNPFTIIGGGSGGGGGFVHNQISIHDSSGGGGGAGGGVVLLYTVNNILIGAAGSVKADGGHGGNGAANLWAGGGGGGGGGSILMFGGNAVTITTANSVSAQGLTIANGGVTDSSGGVGANQAGHGADGRTWLTSSTGGATGPNELPAGLMILFGNVQFQTGVFTATSAALDLANTKPSITNITTTTVTPGGSTVTVTMDSGSASNFTPSYQSTASFIGTKIKRYVKFQVSMNNLQATAPSTELSNITWQYTGNVQTDFKLAASCGMIAANKDQKLPLHWALLYLLPILSAFVLKLKKSAI